MAQPPKMYQMQQITKSTDFLHLIEDRFPANSVTRKEFFALLTGFCTGTTTDGHAVVARANELFRGHPDLIDKFQALLLPDVPKEVERFFERVRRAGTVIFDKFLANLNLLRQVDQSNRDVHAIYGQFRGVFGSGNADLLHDFTQLFLPQIDSLLPCAEAGPADPHQPRLKRKHDADNDAGGAAKSSSSRSMAKKPHVRDDLEPSSRSPISDVGAGSVGGSRPSRAKKPRVRYDPEPTRRSPVFGAVGGSRAKKPRAVHGGENGSALLDGAANGTGLGAAARDNGKRKEVSAFRKAWEFDTGYSKLVATMTRVEELLTERAGGASLEDLFPSRECREFLAEMYGHAWLTMRMLLEDDEYTRSALKVILESLMQMEAKAIEAARSLRDPTRAKQRLHDLVQAMVREEQERRPDT